MNKLASPPNPTTQNFLRWFRALLVVFFVGYVAFSVYGNVTNPDAERPFKLGLDLAGGAHLVYQADTTGVDPLEVPDLMNVLRDVIEHRINIFGVSEPNVYVERSSIVAGEQHERLIVELPGVTDVGEAVAEIGRTPLLEFKLLDRTVAETQQSLIAQVENLEAGEDPAALATLIAEAGDPYIETGLTGRYLETARLEFTGGQGGQGANEPVVSLRFNQEGADLFAEITRANVGEQLAIFLDGQNISSPRINEAITGGTAIISGGFTAAEARDLAQNLSFGALPLPITLVSTQTVGATLGQEVLSKGVLAAVYGLGLVILFMLFWYRLPGLIAAVALVSYIVIMLALFQFVPVTLTAAGLAGFILSLGMAVDANVLVFERLKEELRSGKSTRAAAEESFRRAWGAIRDGNLTSLLSAIILFWFGTSLVKGFALVFGAGVIVSMLSAILITRTLLIALPDLPAESRWARLFGSGLSK